MTHAFRFGGVALALALVLAPCLALAQDKPKTPAQPAPAASEGQQPKKADEVSRRLPVAVEHDDSDPVGTRLAYQLKERLGRSSLMQPTNKDEKKIVIVLKTREEFPGRAGVGSIYSASWLFASRDGSLRYFLASEAGIVDGVSVDQTAEALLGKTDKLASTYGYLF